MTRLVGFLLAMMLCASVALAQPRAPRGAERGVGASIPIAHEDEMRRDLEGGERLCLPISPIECLEILVDLLKRSPHWLAGNQRALERYRELQDTKFESVPAAQGPAAQTRSRLPAVHALYLLQVASLHAAGNASSARLALRNDILFLRTAVVDASARADKEMLSSLLERDYALLDGLIGAIGPRGDRAAVEELAPALERFPNLTATMLPRLDDLAGYVRLLGERARAAADGKARAVTMPELGDREFSWNASTWSYEFPATSEAWREMAARWPDQPPRVQVQMPEHVVLVQPEFLGIRARCTKASCTLYSGDGRSLAARKGAKLDAAFGSGKDGRADAIRFARVESVRPPEFVELGLIIQGRNGDWIGPNLRLLATP